MELLTLELVSFNNTILVCYGYTQSSPGEGSLPFSRCSFSIMVKWANDGLLQANEGKMLVNDDEMLVNDGDMLVNDGEMLVDDSEMSV